MMHDLLILHSALTFMLVGLIWTIQIVHYPLFAEVGPGEFRLFHGGHMWRISLVAGPLMIGEVFTAGLLWWLGQRDAIFLSSLALLPVIWANTFFQQVPQHEKLLAGYDAKVIQRLNHTNWIRTLAWTLRSLCMLWLLC
jgi:hypothetical protein